MGAAPAGGNTGEKHHEEQKTTQHKQGTSFKSKRGDLGGLSVSISAQGVSNLDLRRQWGGLLRGGRFPKFIAGDVFVLETGRRFFGTVPLAASVSVPPSILKIAVTALPDRVGALGGCILLDGGAQLFWKRVREQSNRRLEPKFVSR